METNIEDIINGIAIKLDKEFGEGYTIYTDVVPQGFATPSFGIQFLNVTETRRMQGRYLIQALFDIQYFTDKGRVDAANHSLMLTHNLLNIELVDGQIMLGRELSSEVVDDIAHASIVYSFFVRDQKTYDYMLSLERDIRVNRG